MKITISKKQWESIGKKAGWMVTAKMGDYWIDSLMKHPEVKEQLKNEFNKYLEIENKLNQYTRENFNPNVQSERPYEDRKQERDQIVSELQQQWKNGIMPIIRENNLDYNYGRGRTTPEPDDLKELFGFDRITPV